MNSSPAAEEIASAHEASRLAMRVCLIVSMAFVAAVLTASSLEPVTLSIGGVEIVILPLSFSFAVALLLNVLLYRTLPAAAMSHASNVFAHALPISMLPFLALLGASVGRQFDTVVAAGPALLLQEAGHFLGTVIVAFPISVWVLRLGRETVGATFSIARETSVAIMAQRYGLHSPEGNGVLGVYIVGTLFGTLVFSTIASIFASLGLFSPRALAVACGIGSGSMTAACAGSLAKLVPNLGEEIVALAAASNLIAAVAGFYVTYFGTLPLTEWLYRKVRPQHAALALHARQEEVTAVSQRAKTLDGRLLVGVAAFLCALLAVAVMIASPNPAALELRGTAMLLGISIAALGLGALTRQRLPNLFWASAGGVVVAAPWNSISVAVANELHAVDLLSLAIVPLACAGFALNASDWHNARRVGWKIVIVALAVFLGTFLGSALVAEWLLRV